MGIPHVGDTYTKISIDVDQDISGATVKIVARRPSGKISVWDSAVSGDGQKVEYSTAGSDLDEAGTWTLQAHISMGHWEGYSSEVTMAVGRRIKDVNEP